MDTALTLAQSASSSSLDVNGYTMIVVATLVAGVITVLLIAIGIPTRAHMRNTREREKTKREIAAYVAEGSITPEEGTKMMEAAGRNPSADWLKKC